MATLYLDSTQPIVAVTVDPDHVLPDKDRTNNVLTVEIAATGGNPAPAGAFFARCCASRATNQSQEGLTR